MGKGEGEERQSHDTDEADNVSCRPEEDCCRSTRTLGEGQGFSEETCINIRFPYLEKAR
jgi:hypothetical protein